MLRPGRHSQAQQALAPLSSSLAGVWGPPDTSLYLLSALSLFAAALAFRQQSYRLSFLKSVHDREGPDTDWLLCVRNVCEASVSVPTLQTRKLRFRVVKEHDQDHVVRTWQRTQRGPGLPSI